MNDHITTVLAFRGAFSAPECEAIRALPLTPSAEVGFYPARPTPVRQAESCIVPKDASTSWIAVRLGEYAAKANRSLRVAVSDEIHPMLRVRYGPGDFFDWHSDLGAGAESTRKLSLSLQLSPPEDFQGGEFQFVGALRTMPAPAVGTLLIFPSHFAHRVTPVSRGQRLALVAWMHGPPYA